MATTDESSPFRCSICFNSKEGRQPRILSCVHSFCQGCLKEWYEKRHGEGHCAATQVECPTCRTISALPSGDISDLPIDINVQQFADYFDKASKLSCHVCKIKRGQAACMMCHVFLCEDCGVKHKTSPLFAAHVLSKNVCELHGAALQGVCTSCLCGVCLTCVNEDLHGDHPLEGISSGIQKIKNEVKKCTVDLQEILRQGNLEKDKTRKFIKQFQHIDDMKITLDLIRKEVERLEKEFTEHERLCEAKIDAIFREYKAHSERASTAIVNGNQLLDENEAGVLNKLKSSHIPDKEMCNLLRGSLSSIPDLNSISFSNCRIDHVTAALEALKNCYLVCGIVDIKAIPQTPESPVQLFKRDFGEDYNIGQPWRLCGTPEGDVIVCSADGGPVYKVFRDGKKTLLHDDGRAACVHGGDVYVVSTDGGTVTQIKQGGSTHNHKMTWPIHKPMGLAVTDDTFYVLSSNAINKKSIFGKKALETFHIMGCKSLSYLMKVRHKGMIKLVITDWNTHEVFILGEGGDVLTKFGAQGSQDGLLRYPKGISTMRNGKLLVADMCNNRIVEYDIHGTFVRNLLTKTDGLKLPLDLVYKHPYLWILERSSTLKLFTF